MKFTYTTKNSIVILRLDKTKVYIESPERKTIAVFDLVEVYDAVLAAISRTKSSAHNLKRRRTEVSILRKIQLCWQQMSGGND
jgi:hypothetical protein